MTLRQCYVFQIPPITRLVIYDRSYSHYERWELPFPLCTDLDAGRLECCAFQRYAEDIPLGGSLLRRANDFWKLRALQSSGCHSCRRIFFGGITLKIFPSTSTFISQTIASFALNLDPKQVNAC